MLHLHAQATRCEHNDVQPSPKSYKVYIIVVPLHLILARAQAHSPALVRVAPIAHGANLFESALPIFKPNLTCLDVRPDWLDLEDVLVTALRQPFRLRRIQLAAHATVERFSSFEKAKEQEEVLAPFSQLLSSAKVARDRLEARSYAWTTGG